MVKELIEQLQQWPGSSIVIVSEVNFKSERTGIGPVCPSILYRYCKYPQQGIFQSMCISSHQSDFIGYWYDTDIILADTIKTW